MNFVSPFVYLFYSRLPSRAEKISWILINPVAIFFVTFLSNNVPIAEQTIMFILAFISWQSIYEIGYIYNDVFTVKKESTPTMRISDYERSVIEKNFPYIVIFRIAICILALIVIWEVDQYKVLNLNILWFVEIVIIACIAFSAHNTLRNRWNILTFFLLSATKYLALPVLFAPKYNIGVYIILVLMMFPFVRTLEHATRTRYSILWLQRLVGNLYLFRVKYYAFISCISYLTYLIFHEQCIRNFLFIFFCYFVYRLAIWFLVKKNIVNSTLPNRS